MQIVCMARRQGGLYVRGISCRAICGTTAWPKICSCGRKDLWEHLRVPDPITPACRWLFLLGMLASQLVFIGFESPSQFAEETRKADRTVPKAILWSIIACGILGGALVLVLLFCIQVSLSALSCQHLPSGHCLSLHRLWCAEV